MSSRSRFRSRHERAATLALVVSAAFLFAGCDSGADPGASPSPTASATSSPSTTTSSSATPTISAAYKPADASGPAQNVPVPVLPDVAKTETKEGLEAFTRYWYATLSYAYETGNLDAFARVSPGSCTACLEVSQVIRDWHSDGRWLVGGGVSTPVVEATFQPGPNGEYKVAVQVRQMALTYMRANGTEARTDSQATDRGNLIVVRYVDSQWVVDEVGSIVG